MASKSVGFSVTDAVTRNVVGSGTLTFDDMSFQVSAIAGTINGSTIDGLTVYNASDNKVTFRSIYFRMNTFIYNYGVDSQGIAFSANGIKYNLREPNYDPASNSVQSGDILTSSSGSQENVSLETDTTVYMGQCFRNGTNIMTNIGGVNVENLAIGDKVVVVNGEQRQIVWIGCRQIDCVGDISSWPVRITAGAFGPNLPTRDLYISGGHPVLVGSDVNGQGGHLVPIMCLINGTTIERVAVDRITYWHIELDAHDIVLAEGLPAESYIDLGSRPWFAGADGALHDPDLALPGMPGRCRPVAIDGPTVDAERRRLDAVFAARLASAAAWPDMQNVLLSLL